LSIAAGGGGSAVTPSRAALVSLPQGCWLQVEQALPIGRKKRIEHHDRCDRLFHPLGDAGNNHAAVGMPNQHDVA
jgi:hypothetical protein